MYNRILIKLSGESLAGDTLTNNISKNFDDKVINRIVTEIQAVKDKGTEIMLVVGGGNFWRGRSADSSMNRSKADQIGMLATVMNAIYLTESFKQKNIKSIVMTPFEISGMTVRYSLESAVSYIEKGYILIFAGGIGHPFFSTDTIASLRACELSCDCILYAKNIDGIYDSDPKLNENAIRYKEITYNEIIEKNLKAIDISAINLCNENKIPSVAFDLNKENSIIIASDNTDEIFKIGTRVNYN